MAKDHQCKKDTSINNFYPHSLNLAFKSKHYSDCYLPLCLLGQTSVTVKRNSSLASKDFLHCSKKNRADFVLVCWNAKYSLLWVRMKSFSHHLLVRWDRRLSVQTETEACPCQWWIFVKVPFRKQQRFNFFNRFVQASKFHHSDCV